VLLFEGDRRLARFERLERLERLHRFGRFERFERLHRPEQLERRGSGLQLGHRERWSLGGERRGRRHGGDRGRAGDRRHVGRIGRRRGR
jgi:hypothetical protein